MKAHYRPKNKAPNLVTYLELNQKYGVGYQARMVMEGMAFSVIDNEPYDLYEVAGGVAAALEEINKQTGYNYELHKILRIDGEAIEANRNRDFASAKFARDIEEGKGLMTYPESGVADYTKKVIDGQEEIMLSGRGVVLLTYFSWTDDKLPKAREALRRYCEYLAMHGYGAGAADILAEVDAMDKERGADWIKATHGKYVKDDAALMRYVMGG